MAGANAREQFWRKVVAEFEASGKTVAQFRRDWTGERFGETAFWTWRKRIQAADGKATPGAEPQAEREVPAGGKPAVATAANRPERPAFVPARVVEAAPTRDDRVEVELPSGVKLRVGAGALRQLIEALGG